MYQHTKLPSYLPMPRFLMNFPISNTAKLLYTQLLSKAQLSQKNAWVDAQGRVYFIYPIHQMAVDMDKSITTIKDALRELVASQLLEKIPQEVPIWEKTTLTIEEAAEYSNIKCFVPIQIGFRSIL